MSRAMIDRILGQKSTPAEPAPAPAAKFPIALICSQSIDGECFARAIPLWNLLSNAFELSSRESMLNALIKAQSIFSDSGDPLRMLDADAFARVSDNRQVLAIACPDAIQDRGAIHEALSSIPDDLSPGPIVSLGNGESSFLADIRNSPNSPEWRATSTTCPRSDSLFKSLASTPECLRFSLMRPRAPKLIFLPASPCAFRKNANFYPSTPAKRTPSWHFLLLELLDGGRDERRGDV